MAGALRTIINDHLDEIEQDEQLTRAERWQRDEAWATTQTIVDGTAREGGWEELASYHAAAVRRLRNRRTSR